MAKAPLEGTVKTRLIGELSPAEAAELYVSFLSDTFATAREVQEESDNLSIVLCYTPEGEEEAFEAVEREGSLMVPQRGADLGERMANCFSDMFASGFDSAVIIGADSPTLAEDTLYEAFEALAADFDLVLGPSADGGYYLIGMRRLHEQLFRGIAWSTSSVFADTLARAGDAGLGIHTLPEWYDVDTPEDLRRLRLEIDSDRDRARHTGKFLRKLERERARKSSSSE